MLHEISLPSLESLQGKCPRSRDGRALLARISTGETDLRDGVQQHAVMCDRFRRLFGPEFSDEEVLGFLPFVLIELTHLNPELELSPRASELLADFAGSLGIGPDTSPDEAWRKLQDHQRAHPPCGELKVRFEQLVREVTRETGASSDAYLGFMGQQRHLIERREKKADAVDSGPMARFQLRGWRKDA
jgi:hypothetical protein